MKAIGIEPILIVLSRRY